jgi:hypothetical protein
MQMSSEYRKSGCDCAHVVQGFAHSDAKVCSAKHMIIALEFEVFAPSARAGAPIDIKNSHVRHLRISHL